MTFPRRLRFWLLPLALGAAVLARAGDLASRVVILANSREPDSVALARFYADQRGVPQANIIALPMPETESISWREFIDQVYQPVQDELYRRGWLEGTASTLTDRFGRKRYGFIGHNISYLVTCRGVPLSIYNDPALLAPNQDKKYPDQFYTDRGAVDSELSLLAQSGYEITGMIANPLFANDVPSEVEEELVVKVSRLDGPTWESARQLVRSALAGEKNGLLGRYYIDLKGGPSPEGDKWLESDRTQLDRLGFDGSVEDTRATFGAGARFDAPVLYFGWYASRLNGPFANPGFVFPPGAVAVHIHSQSARTLHSDSSFWCGPLIARGVAATVGNVGEPYLELTHRLNLLLQALIQGKTFGDAAFYAVPTLSWQAIAIGDPLYRPFKVSLAEQEKHAGRLPPMLAPYAVLRRSNLQWHRGEKAAAVATMRHGLKQYPGLVIGLALADRLLEGGDPSAGVLVLQEVALARPPQPEDWALLRQAAGFLAAHQAEPAAVTLYAALAGMPAPNAATRLAMLTEARAAAKKAGDPSRARDFARQIREIPAK